MHDQLSTVTDVLCMHNCQLTRCLSVILCVTLFYISRWVGVTHVFMQPDHVLCVCNMVVYGVCVVFTVRE